jgi:hypothetical protein
MPKFSVPLLTRRLVDVADTRVTRRGNNCQGDDGCDMVTHLVTRLEPLSVDTPLPAKATVCHVHSSTLCLDQPLSGLSTGRHALASISYRPMFADILLGRPFRAPPGILGFVKKVRLNSQVPLHKHRHRAGHTVLEDRRK